MAETFAAVDGMPEKPPTYSRQALVEKGMSKGWDRARAEAAADVKLARETAKVWESAAPSESFSEVARRAQELVPDVYMAPEAVSSMPTLLPRQKVELPVTGPSAARPAPTTSERWKDRPLRPLSSLTPGEVRAIDIAEREREDVVAEAARERAGETAKFLPPLGFALGGPAGAALGAGVGAFAKPVMAGVARLQERLGETEPTVMELALRMQEEAPPAPPPSQVVPSATTLAVRDELLRRQGAPSSQMLPLLTQPADVSGMPVTEQETPSIAYRVPQTNLPAELVSAAGRRIGDLADVSMAFPNVVSGAVTDIVRETPAAIGGAFQSYEDLVARSGSQAPLRAKVGRSPSLSELAENTQSLGAIPLQATRERATSARMFQAQPEEIVPLGDYRLDQALFDVIDTPEGAVEKGLDTTPGFQMWEKENPVRAQVARRVVAQKKAAEAPVQRAEQRTVVREKTVMDLLAQDFLPSFEKMRDYNLTPEEYRFLQVAASTTGKQTQEGDMQVLGNVGGQRVRDLLELRKEDPTTFAELVAALPR